jgi:hypothetical protein
VQGPAAQVVLAHLDREARRAVRGLEFPLVLHDLEGRVPGRHLVQGAGQGPPAAAEPAEQRPAHRVVVGFNALNLSFAADPGRRAYPGPPERLPSAHPMPDGPRATADVSRVPPPALERLDALGPAEVERLQTTDVPDLHISHVAPVMENLS